MARVLYGEVEAGDGYYLDSLPDFSRDPDIQERKNELLTEASHTLSGMLVLGEELGIDDPFLSPEVLANAVKRGLLDAPQLIGGGVARGDIRTRIIDGKCVAVDKFNDLLDEKDRLARIGINISDSKIMLEKQIYNKIYGGA